MPLLCAHLLALLWPFGSVMYVLSILPESAMKGSCEMRQQVGASKLFSSSRTEGKGERSGNGVRNGKSLAKSSLNATDVNIMDGVMKDDLSSTAAHLHSQLVYTFTS